MSVTFDEDTGNARIIIEGYIPSSAEADDPIVEIFRPIRHNQKEIHVTIIVYRDRDSVTCTLLPSNSRERPQDEFLKVAKRALKGDTRSGGIISQYLELLDKFFQDEEGLQLYLSKIEQIKETNDGPARTVVCNECNQSIKKFVEKCGLTMPSFKKVKKTKEQKREESKAYLAAHPELKKKPAN